MKDEKIKKHMLRRTVVAVYGGLVGVIKGYDAEQGTAVVEGFRYGSARNQGGPARVGSIRKATAEERAEFYERVDADERGVNDGFARFGGMPRGFEAWRAAQHTLVEPTSEPTVFTVGQRVRICGDGGCVREFFNEGDVCVVVDPNTGGEHSILVTRGGLRCYARPDQLELVANEPEPVVATHKVGDLRVWLRSNGIGAVARITAHKDGVVTFAEYKAYSADAVLEPTRGNVARLVAEQRERGVSPEAGDLVFVVRSLRKVTCEIGIVSWCLEERDIKITSVEDGGDDEESCYYPRHHDAHVLVIRRNPLAELRND